MIFGSFLRLTDANVEFVYDMLRDLLGRNLVKYYDNGVNWIRNIVSGQDSHGKIALHER